MINWDTIVTGNEVPVYIITIQTIDVCCGGKEYEMVT